jgi:hypothetical protein
MFDGAQAGALLPFDAVHAKCIGRRTVTVAFRSLRARLTAMLSLALIWSCFAANTLAQSNTTGDLTGIVTDVSGAVVPGATVTLRSVGTGESQAHTTSPDGTYRFALLKPGEYEITTQATGFQSLSRVVAVNIGQATTLNLQLQVGAASESVEVSSAAPLIQTDNGNNLTTFNDRMISQVPNPGNDLTAIAQSAPGVVMNTQAGQGNFSANGISATSNLFTYDGMNENDPFFNVNSSGATNLLLGTNDVQEATIVVNGYSGQYGGLAGANVNFVSKSGSNQWHGNAIYSWNGRALNANSFFNVRNGAPRPFENANQWATSFGGPIRKDKTFFFVDYEGLRVVNPGVSQPVNIPSPQFQAAALANLTDPASVAFYQQMFNLYNNASGVNRAVPIAGGGCSGIALPSGAPCILQFQSTSTNFTHEYLVTARVDQNFGPNDRVFARFRTDHGLQATNTDPIDPIFNTVSQQPQYEGQLSWAHNFSANAVNQFIFSTTWYSAVFKPADFQGSLQTLPIAVQFTDSSFTALGGLNFAVPQGRNVTQYQFVDDFSLSRGKHQLKFGANFRRNDVTDYDPGINSVGNVNTDITHFFMGQGTNYTQQFPQSLTNPVALYVLGVYGQDEWAVSPKLRLTFALRAEHYSNPVCQTNCFARFPNNFADISHDVNQPYNQAIQFGLHRALKSLNAISWQPRFSFAYSMHPDLVIRGGFGLFSDAFPAVIADSFMNNSPTNNGFVVGPGLLSPGAPNSQATQAANANQLFLQSFASGGTLASIQAIDPLFVPPSLVSAAGSIHNPVYEEWNLQIQKAFGPNMSLTMGYNGNHGYHEVVNNVGVNAFNPAGFVGLPLAPPDARFGTVTEYDSAAVSNYNGLSVSFTRRFSAGLQFQANYTWSHALDEVSNGGFLRYNFNTNNGVLNQLVPTNLRLNYGNADYDTRHYFSANYVWDVPVKKLVRRGPDALINGWQLSGTIFARSGLPFSVTDGNAIGLLGGLNYQTLGGDLVLANWNGQGTTNCSSSANNPATPCLSLANFTPATNGFGQQRRNQFYGPHYFNTDMSIMKNFPIPRFESARLTVGAQFFNLFNHPNFDQPVQDIANPQFGSNIATVSTPTSIIGSFLGGDASPRLIQLTARITF